MGDGEPGSPGPRVVMVERQPALRAAVAHVLEDDGFDVCAQADDVAGGLSAVERERPDVCILGLPLGQQTRRMIARIAERPGTAVIVLTASRSPESMIDAIRAGATGYLLKRMNPERIPPAVRGVLAGEAAMPRTLAIRLIREIQKGGSGRHLNGQDGQVQLTARQWDVLNLMADGLDTGQISARLLISPVTVRRHVSAILSRLGVEDREAAVAILAANR